MINIETYIALIKDNSAVINNPVEILNIVDLFVDIKKLIASDQEVQETTVIKRYFFSDGAVADYIFTYEEATETEKRHEQVKILLTGNNGFYGITSRELEL